MSKNIRQSLWPNKEDQQSWIVLSFDFCAVCFVSTVVSSHIPVIGRKTHTPPITVKFSLNLFLINQYKNHLS